MFADIFPSGAEVIASSTEYATSWGTQFLPIIYITIGMTVSYVAIRYVSRATENAIRALMDTGSFRISGKVFNNTIKEERKWKKWMKKRKNKI